MELRKIVGITGTPEPEGWNSREPGDVEMMLKEVDEYDREFVLVSRRSDAIVEALADVEDGEIMFTVDARSVDIIEAIKDVVMTDIDVTIGELVAVESTTCLIEVPVMVALPLAEA